MPTSAMSTIAIARIFDIFQSVIRNTRSATTSERPVVMFNGEFAYEARTSDAALAVVGRRMAGQ